MAIRRLERLQRMLAQVGSAEPSPNLESLERRTGNREGPVLDTRRIGARRLEVEFALESLDVLRKEKEVDVDQGFALEAIVMPYYRPVVDVSENRMKTEQLTTKWDHLAADELRAQIEQCFLSVGRINVPGLPSLPYAGTGFLVGTDLLMTNRHVAEIFAQGLGIHQLDFRSGQSAMVDFYHENGRTQSERFDVDRVMMIHPYWDMALLKVRGVASLRKPLALSVIDPADLVEREVLVIGYPGYDPWGDAEFQRIQDRIFRSTYYVKRMQPGILRARQPVESFHRQVRAVTHDSSTLGGNSGSVVVLLPKPGENAGQEGLQVIGLHFAGEYLVANYAVPSSDMALDSRIVDAGVKFTGRVQAHERYRPIWREVDIPEVRNPPPAQLPSSAPLSTGPERASTTTITTAGWIVPIEISVTIGQPVPGATSTATVDVRPAPVEGVFASKPPIATSALPYPFSAASLAEADFDWRTALSLALASRLAYESPQAVRATAEDMWQLHKCQFIEANDTQCYVAETPQAILVSFRGTESVGDWLADLNVAGRVRPYGVVHRGFLGAFQAVEQQLLAVLEASPHQSLLLTGHSLGGALATVAAAEWQQRFNVRWIMTYGQPAVGKGGFEQFMQRYARNFFRFVNDDDVVTRVPPTYRHVGQLIHFDTAGNLPAGAETPVSHRAERMLTAAEFDRMRAALLQQRAQRRAVGMESLETPVVEGLLPSLSDHRMDAYITKIAAHISTVRAAVQGRS
ncbi:trypsin-like peptidase domain-containing protein [Bradyrhizobium barranii]|uniref:lipase family protein n=1 Tax=Bradyrhizobium barranii TaxID=2992140 RepID=UPI0024AE9989|nr:trypsin-like peptidase domain-containing protein [Bradyrhizobium barranii]WFT94421.1 trypsin-like peptidase domain-containing protein [Bradyrhizobium barranii]